MTATPYLRPALEKRIPAALVAAFFVQTAGALFWAGSAAERITVLEQAQARAQSAIERVAVMQEEIAQIEQTLARIENKLDRAPAP